MHCSYFSVTGVLNHQFDPPKKDTCRTAADAAWKVLDKAGASAYDGYWADWATLKPPRPPVKCKRDCKCGPENYLATFNWENNTMYYKNNGAKSSGPGFFALATFFISFSVMANF